MGIRRIDDVAGKDLVWVQTSRRKHAYEQRTGEDVVATDDRHHGPRIVTRVADGRWTFKPTGFWRRRMAVASE